MYFKTIPKRTKTKVCILVMILSSRYLYLSQTVLPLLCFSINRILDLPLNHCVFSFLHIFAIPLYYYLQKTSYKIIYCTLLIKGQYTRNNHRRIIEEFIFYMLMLKLGYNIWIQLIILNVNIFLLYL